MLQCVLTAYQRITRPSSTRRTVHLSVMALEDRITPAVAETLVLPIQPPQVPMVSAPATTPAEPAVRSDLFGPGAVESPDAANDLATLLSADQPPEKADVAEIEEVNPEVVEDAGESVVIEDMIFLPQVN